MTVEILICTIDDGIYKVGRLLMSPMPGVCYLVSWQRSQRSDDKHTDRVAMSEGLPEDLCREDVRVIQLEGKGLSRNRNYALRHAKGDLLVIADDDNRYTSESIAHIYQAYALHPDAAIWQFQAYTTEGVPLRKYPSVAYEYATRPRNAYVSSCEIVLNRAAPLPFFDERFGLGTYLSCGEEDLFVHQTSQRGLKVYYEPLKLVVTPAGTTGTRFAELPGVQRAKGGVLTLLHGPTGAVLRCLKFAVTYPGVGLLSRIRFFHQMLKGVSYVLHNHPVS